MMRNSISERGRSRECEAPAELDWTAFEFPTSARPSQFNPALNSDKYFSTVGRNDALITVVLARSYSLNSGRTSLLKLTVSPAATQARPIICSWAGFTKL